MNKSMERMGEPWMDGEKAMKKTCATCRWFGEWKSRLACENENSGRVFVSPDDTCPHWSPTLEEDPEDGKYTGLTEEE